MAWYVWTPIRTEKETLAQGTEVSSSDFSDSDWEQLVEARVVRNATYPSLPENYQGSPKQFILEERKRQLDAISDSIDDDNGNFEGVSSIADSPNESGLSNEVEDEDE